MTNLGDVKPAQWITSSRRMPTSKTPTRAKVLRAQREAVGGRRKRCRRGKNCSAACIQSGMICLVEFPLPVSKALGKARNELADYIAKKNNLKAGSVQEKRINAALEQMSSVIKVATQEDKTKKPDVEWKRDSKRAERVALPWKEIQDLQKRRKVLSDAELERDAMRALHKEVTSRGLRLPRAELEMIYDVLPKNVQTSLAKSGRAGQGQWYAGKDDQGKSSFSNGASKERGIAVLDLYLRQGGTSAWESRGSKIWAAPDLSIEHMIPLAKGGIDAPSNWILVRRGANLERQSKNLGKWIDGLPKSREEYKTYVEKYATNKRRSRATKAAAALIDPKKMSDQEIFGKGAKGLALLFRSENGNKTPGTFTKEWLGINDASTRTGNSGPPAPFAKGLGVIAKTQGLSAARDVGNRMKTIWNKNWKQEGKITKQQAFQQMMSEMKSSMSAEQFNNLFSPAAMKWANTNGFL